MKKLFITLLLSFIAVSAHCAEYAIVGKGSSGQTKCSGYIFENTFFDKIELYVSDMLNQEYRIYKKIQVNENTIKYKCGLYNEITLDDYIIIKQKCPNAQSVYFFEFPPLYDGQGRVTYKVVKK